MVIGVSIFVYHSFFIEKPCGFSFFWFWTFSLGDSPFTPDGTQGASVCLLSCLTACLICFVQKAIADIALVCDAFHISIEFRKEGVHLGSLEGRKD